METNSYRFYFILQYVSFIERFIDIFSLFVLSTFTRRSFIEQSISAFPYAIITTTRIIHSLHKILTTMYPKCVV